MIVVFACTSRSFPTATRRPPSCCASPQEKIEQALYRRYLLDHSGPPRLFLYDVTSSYLEGEQNELGAYGYNRDGHDISVIAPGDAGNLPGWKVDQLPVDFLHDFERGFS